MKELFTTEEWETVRCVPVQAFFIVAGADADADAAEFEEFAGRMLRGGMTYKDDLHREVAREFASDDPAKRVKLASETDMGETKALLRSKLSAEQYQSFLGSIFIDAVAVANASGLPGAEVSQSEANMLAAFAMAWDLDLEEVSRIFAER